MKFFGYSGIDRKKRKAQWVLVTDLTMKLVWCSKTQALWHQPFLELQLIYQAMGHHRLVEVGWKTSSTSDNALGLEVLFIGVVLVSLVEERRRVTASAIHGTNWSNIPGEREMGCGPTGAVLYRVAEWSVLATEDESWLVGFGCAATHLDCYRSCPGKRIAYTTWALWGHTESAKEQWKNHQKLPKTIFLQWNINRKPVMGKPKKAARRACQTNSRRSSFLLMPK